MIVFVDDDRRYIKNYIEELKIRKHQVTHHYDIDDAFDFIVKNHAEIEILILDMMMPPGALLEHKDRQNGRRTGILFVEEVKNQIGAISFPLIIFTHVNVDNLDSSYEKIQKEDYSISEFADRIEESIKSFKLATGNK